MTQIKIEVFSQINLHAMFVNHVHFVWILLINDSYLWAFKYNS